MKNNFPIVANKLYVDLSDLKNFEQQNNVVVQSLRDRHSSDDSAHQRVLQLLHGDRTSKILMTMHLAKYLGGKTQSQALKVIKDCVTESFEVKPILQASGEQNPQIDNPLYIKQRMDFIDCLRAFLPKEKFKDLHLYIDAHLEAEEGWKFAREQSKLEL